MAAPVGYPLLTVPGAARAAQAARARVAEHQHNLEKLRRRTDIRATNRARSEWDSRSVSSWMLWSLSGAFLPSPCGHLARLGPVADFSTLADLDIAVLLHVPK
jgi:hypothetical protein